MAESQHPPITLSPDFFAKADKEREQVRDAIQADLNEQLASAIAQAPNGGAYVGDVPAPPVQGALPMPPGFVGALAQFIYQQAPRPVAEVAIVGALGLMAGVCGKVWHIPGSGLNLYVVLVARSAIGKEAMHSGISKIIRAAAVKCPIAGNFANFDDYVSGPALIKACAGNPSFVNVAGEIGHKFLQMATTNDANARSLRKALTTLYSKSGPTDVAGGIAYSSQENNVEAVTSVAFSLIGETTPNTFYESITDAMMRDGFMSRFCVIEYGGDRPAKNAAPIQHPPQGVVDHIAGIMAASDLAMAAGKVQEVAFSDGARTHLDRFEDECDAAIHAAGDDENLRQLWNRAHLKALRVAALLAVGDTPFGPIVTVEQAEWAVTLIRHGVAAFDRRIRQGEVGEGSDGGREAKVLDLCREFLNLPADSRALTEYKYAPAMQQAWIVPRNYLQRRTQRLSAFEKFKLGHTVALNMAIKTAISNGNLMEVKKEPLSEQFNFGGQAYRVISLK